MSDQKTVHDHELSRREKNRVAAENTIDFYHELHSKGIDLSDSQIDQLIKSGRIDDPLKVKKQPKKKGPQKKIKVFGDPILKSQQGLAADAYIDIVHENKVTKKIILTKEQYNEERKKYYYKGGLIRKKDWAPENSLQHTAAFIAWINSINAGFASRVEYYPFTLYCQQAADWLSDPSDIRDSIKIEDKRLYVYQEFSRCDENSLYFLDKYIKLKDGKDPTISGDGYDDDDDSYVSAPVHRVLCYLDDCGYSFFVGKPRQIAATSTFGALAIKTVIFQKNSYVKFITMDLENTGTEIFEDKMKYPFSALNPWMKPAVSNDRDNKFVLKRKMKKKKGTVRGVNSKISVVAPSVPAINGGSPTKVYIDEGGYISIISKMIKEARPTLFGKDRKTGLLKMKRQIIGWSCVCAGTKVWNKLGRLVNIEDLQREEGILGYDGNGMNKEDIVWMKPPVKKPCYRIKTDGGNSIDCSFDHPLMWSKNKWDRNIDSEKVKRVTFTAAEKIKVGDQLIMIDKAPVFGKKDVSYARILGLLIGDGSYSFNSTPQLCVADDEIYEHVEQGEVDSKVYVDYKTKNGVRIRKVGFRGFREKLKSHGMFGQVKLKKRLPKNIHTFSQKSVCELLGGYFDADGNVTYYEKKNAVRIVLTSICEELLIEVKYQLLKLGIHSCVIKENRNSGEKFSEGQLNHIYRLYINKREDVFRFQEKIHFVCKKKQETLDFAKTLTGRFRYNIKRASFEINSDNNKGRFFKGKDNLKGLRFSTVISVEYIGEKEVYNMHTGHSNTYLSNGYVTKQTGGEMDKAGKAFEEEYYYYLDAWNAGNYNVGIIPIFLDWTTRPGITQEFYDQEKAAYEKGSGDKFKNTSMEERMNQFRQHYPTTIEDMFLTSEKTLMTGSWIADQLDRINTIDHKVRPQYGRFEPVFDFDHPVENQDVPYKIKGSVFVPASDDEVLSSPVTLFSHPKDDWIHRYKQGTDPIQSDNGFSNMSSTMLDSYFMSPACLVDYRSNDHKEVFLQCMLMNMYYKGDSKHEVKELVEMNVATAYIDYLVHKGYFYHLVENSELPDLYRGGKTLLHGIDNHGNRTKLIIATMKSFMVTYGTRMFIKEYYFQLRTFVCMVTASMVEKWGTKDPQKYRDDNLFSLVFAYICDLTYEFELPIKINEDEPEFVTTYPIVRDKDGNLTRKPKREKVY